MRVVAVVLENARVVVVRKAWGILAAQQQQQHWIRLKMGVDVDRDSIGW
jgi:hypothetical protein